MKNGVRLCLAKMLGSGGVAFATLLSAAENIEKFLPWNAALWMIVGPLFAALWALEVLCGPDHGENDE